jgi:hypothetical protein
VPWLASVVLPAWVAMARGVASGKVCEGGDAETSGDITVAKS